jgi:hypothetical protein
MKRPRIPLRLPFARRSRITELEDQLATVRATLATVRRERDHDVRLLRQIRYAGLIPKGSLLRSVNSAVAQESED